MEFQKLIETRRTVRKYAADSEVTREQMETLIHAAQEAPSWKNSQTGRYYCVLSREIVDKIRATCLPGAGNAGKSENAALIVTTFVHDRAGFQKDGTADNELGNGWGCGGQLYDFPCTGSTGADGRLDRIPDVFI